MRRDSTTGEGAARRRGPGQSPEIRKAIVQVAMEQLQIDFGVLVHEHVAKSLRAKHALAQVNIDHAALIENEQRIARRPDDVAAGEKPVMAREQYASGSTYSINLTGMHTATCRPDGRDKVRCPGHDAIY